jgi:hypothetical protein
MDRKPRHVNSDGKVRARDKKVTFNEDFLQAPSLCYIESIYLCWNELTIIEIPSLYIFVNVTEPLPGRSQPLTCGLYIATLTHDQIEPRVCLNPHWDA